MSNRVWLDEEAEYLLESGDDEGYQAWLDKQAEYLEEESGDDGDWDDDW